MADASVESITDEEVEGFKKHVEVLGHTSTSEESRVRLIACGALREDGTPMTPSDYEENWLHAEWG